jgi:hypothetical protein
VIALRVGLVLGLVFALSAAVIACTENVPPPPGGGTGGDGGTGASAGDGGVAGSGGTAGTGGLAGGGGSAGAAGRGGMGGEGGSGGVAGTGGTGSTGACNNATDQQALLALLPSNARQVAAICDEGVDCDQTDQVGLTACVTDCVQQTVSGLSVACASCYGEFEWCNRGCSSPCADDSCAPPCDTCTDASCIPALRLCAGPLSGDCGEN